MGFESCRAFSMRSQMSIHAGRVSKQKAFLYQEQQALISMPHLRTNVVYGFLLLNEARALQVQSLRSLVERD